MDIDFEMYLRSKKIDPAAFRAAEPELWETWKTEFDQIHPNSFTVQKLNLINPIRRKYQLPPAMEVSSESGLSPKAAPSQPTSKPGRPVIRPKLG